MTDSQRYIREARERRQAKQVARQKKVESAPRPSYYDGHDGVTGRPIVRVSGGSGVPLESLSNIQGDIGQQGRVVAGSFDTGSAVPPVSGRRRNQKGTIKTGVRVDFADRVEFWVGGDRKTPALILSIPKTPTEFIQTTAFESTGNGQNDWLFTVAQRRNGTPYQSAKIQVLKGDGTAWDSGYSVKNNLMQHFGNGFWASVGRLTPASLGNGGVFIRENPAVTTATGAISEIAVGGLSGSAPPGALFSSVEWHIPVLYLQDPSAIAREVIKTQTGNEAGFFDPNAPSIFDWNASANSSKLDFKRLAWDVSPGGDVGSLPGGNTPCAGPGATVVVSPGKYVETLIRSEESNLTYQSFSINLYKNVFSEQSGVLSRTVSKNFSSITVDWQGGVQTITAACTVFQQGNYFTLSASYAPPPGANSSHYNGRNIDTTNTALSVFIAPGVQKPYRALIVSDSEFTSVNAVTSSASSPALSTEENQPRWVFNKGQSYFYNKQTSELNQAGTTANLLNVDGGDLQTTPPNGAFEYYSWVVSEGQLALYQVDFDAFAVSTLATTQKFEVAKFTRTGNQFEKDPTAVAAKRLPIKITGSDATNTSVIGAYWWPA